MQCNDMALYSILYKTHQHAMQNTHVATPQRFGVPLLLAIADVVQNAAGKKDGLLLHEAHLGTIPLEVQGSNVMPVKQHTATQRIIEALKQCYLQLSQVACSSSDRFLQTTWRYVFQEPMICPRSIQAVRVQRYSMRVQQFI